jgi:hypothetical protein
MSPRIRRTLVLALALDCGAATAAARIDTQIEGACPVLFRTIEIDGPRLRIELEPAGGEPFASIFDGDEDLVTSLIPSQKRFLRMEVDADAADYSGDVASSSVTYIDRQLAQAQAMMAEQCKRGGCPQMPDLAAMMGRPAAPANPITTRDTTEVATFGNLSCTWREWVRSDVVLRRECLADIAALPIPEADRAGLRRGMRVMTNYGESMGAIRDRFVADPEPPSPPGKLIVAQVCLANGAEVGRSSATTAEVAIDPARFQVPADYAPMGGFGRQ